MVSRLLIPALLLTEGLVGATRGRGGQAELMLEGGACEFAVEPTTPYFWDPTCASDPETVSLGCLADGKNKECRFCQKPPYQSIKCLSEPADKKKVEKLMEDETTTSVVLLHPPLLPDPVVSTSVLLHPSDMPDPVVSTTVGGTLAGETAESTTSGVLRHPPLLPDPVVSTTVGETITGETAESTTSVVLLHPPSVVLHPSDVPGPVVSTTVGGITAGETAESTTSLILRHPPLEPVPVDSTTAQTTMSTTSEVTTELTTTAEITTTDGGQAKPGRCEFAVEPTTPYFWDPNCASMPSVVYLGCLADGKHMECRFCQKPPYQSVKCHSDSETPAAVITAVTKPTTTKTTTTKSTTTRTTTKGAPQPHAKCTLQCGAPLFEGGKAEPKHVCGQCTVIDRRWLEMMRGNLCDTTLPGSELVHSSWSYNTCCVRHWCT